MRTLVFSLAFTSLVGFALAQAPNAAGPNAAGRQQFETRCAHCHGGDATGGEGGPNIIDQIDSRTQSELADFLRTGRPASGMPAFDLPTQEMTALTAYVRTLVPVPSGDPLPEVRKKIQTTDACSTKA
jgi:mono/diheme cytochrome c family protein